MRKTSLDTAYKMAKTNTDIVFIGSDLGVNTLDNFRKEMPERFFMEGISEAHVIGMASGLAMSGKTVFVNTIATFFSRRAYEQIAIDLGLYSAKVRLISNGGGLVYAPLGPTHLAIEDIALMRVIPNMSVIVPADAVEMEKAVLASEGVNGPVYFRVAKGGDPVVTESHGDFVWGEPVLHTKNQKEGDLLLVTTGVTLNRAIKAREELEKQGLKVGIVHCPCIKPLNENSLKKHLFNFKAVMTLEEHTLIGGLGSLVADIMMEEPIAQKPFFKKVGIPDVFPDQYGSQDNLMALYGLDVESIVKKALTLTNRH